MTDYPARYKYLLDSYMALSLRDRTTSLRHRTGIKNLFLKLLHIQLEDVRSKCVWWTVKCIKSCYVGQGMSFEPGDVVQDYVDKDEAQAHVNRCNADAWAKDCFELSSRPYKG